MTRAERIQRQDEVAFPTVKDAENALNETPEEIIDWLLDCLEQAQAFI